MKLARKDFESSRHGYESFKAEDMILRELINSKNCPSSIVTSICSVVHTREGQKTPLSSIFFLPARCNLAQYITNRENFEQSSIARRQNFKQMLSICQGLEWLGQNLVWDTGEDKFRYATYHHCDLKPDNILVDGKSCDGSLVFKIADFGEAKALEGRPQNDKRVKDSYTISGRAGTFIAPESQPSMAEGGASKSLTKSDVWSFGCILLLVILFGYEGAEGVQRFEDAREKASDLNPKTDSFYAKDTICKAAVTNMIEHLQMTLGKRRGKDNSDSNLNKEALHYLQGHILVKHDKRKSITEVSAKLREFYNVPPLINADFIPRNDVPSDCKYCLNSPNGRILYYSAREVKVYRHDYLLPIATLNQKSWEGAWSDSITPRSKACSTDALCIVSKPSIGPEATVSEKYSGRCNHFAPLMLITSTLHYTHCKMSLNHPSASKSVKRQTRLTE